MKMARSGLSDNFHSIPVTTEKTHKKIKQIAASVFNFGLFLSIKNTMQMHNKLVMKNNNDVALTDFARTGKISANENSIRKFNGIFFIELKGVDDIVDSFLLYELMMIIIAKIKE
jgi:hypothetical protein